VSETQRDFYDLETDVSRDLYNDLIDFALGRCPTACLIVRDQIELGESGELFLSALEPYLVGREKTDRWPGTELFGSEAEIVDFRLEAGSAQLLKSATDHLFGWLQPDLPEDLCFLHADHTPWLTTIAHEDEGYFILTEDEARQLREALPRLRILASAS
jgi:hypothetical protein